MKIRKANENDLEALLSIGGKVKEFIVAEGERFWNKKQLKDWVNSEDDVVLVAEEKEEIIGFVMYSNHIPTGKATFENAWVSGAHRGKGLGTALIKKGEKILKEKGAKYLVALVGLHSKSSEEMLLKNEFRKGFKFNWFYKEIK